MLVLIRDENGNTLGYVEIDQEAEVASAEVSPNGVVLVNVVVHDDEADEIAESRRQQEAEMRAETFAAEALMGMARGTTEGWYDEPDIPDPQEDYPEPEEEEVACHMPRWINPETGECEHPSHRPSGLPPLTGEEPNE